MKTGLAIAKRREKLGLSQVDLAKAIGVSKASVCRWESGDISNMRRDRIQKLADALRISPLDLLDEETDGFHVKENALAADGESEEDMLTQRMTLHEWEEAIKGLTRENKIKLFEYAQLLLISQGRDEKSDQ